MIPRPPREAAAPDAAPGLTAADRRAALLAAELREGTYLVRFARDAADLERVLRLRFRIFNEELGEGLEESWRTGRDEDRFDRVCDHLMLIDTRSDEVVGTYRMQTSRMARVGEGFYCDQEFDLSTLPVEALDRSIELGRACISARHRNGLALFGLWRGLAAYLTWSGTHLLFGCCSLTTQDPREGLAMLRYLEKRGRISAEFHVEPRPEFACEVPPGGATDLPEVVVPRLFGTYLRHGALACGPPAIDRAFKTIDFFIVLDSLEVPDRVRAMFFSNLPADLLAAGREARLLDGRASVEGAGA